MLGWLGGILAPNYSLSIILTKERSEVERTLMDSMKVLLCLVSFFTVLGEC